ncbi:MAG: SCO family protein [Cytophagales bacterium]|nr:MAG: SCO family protein [Cytophagales bacterium]
MKKASQYIILSILLILPVLVYLFLKNFGENHYRLPYYFPTEISEPNEKGKIDTTFHVIPDFKAINQNKDSVSLANFENQILVVDFFFTRCPGICPKMTSQLTRIQEIFKDKKEVSILSFTVDPEFDSPEVLTKYAQKFGIDIQTWQLLKTNTKVEVFNLGFYGFKVPSDTVDKFLHSEKIILVDKQKHIRGFYSGTEKKEVDRLTTEIGVLLYEYEHKK